ncbi:MAG TPA: hypothetical protein VIJ25_16600, partial [Methylococcales bacterium]
GEGDVGKNHLSNFQDVDLPTPTILTTSQMLTTGIDAEMVKNVVLARVVNSLAEFKQIMGRGTRLKIDYGKEFFNIIDYTGTATRYFADKDFDGEPEYIDETIIDKEGETTTFTVEKPELEDTEKKSRMKQLFNHQNLRFFPIRRQCHYASYM